MEEVKSEEWEKVHMSIYSQGIEQGLVRGRQEAILDLLLDYGLLEDKLPQKITNETDAALTVDFNSKSYSICRLIHSTSTPAT